MLSAEVKYLNATDFLEPDQSHQLSTKADPEKDIFVVESFRQMSVSSHCFDLDHVNTASVRSLRPCHCIIFDAMIKSQVICCAGKGYKRVKYIYIM